MLELAHPAWRSTLQRGLHAMNEAQPGYLPELLDGPFLPTEGRLFAAFAVAPQEIRHVLIGEGPYPRAASATGVCFMDGAVGSLWSATGLSKAVNRATSLRNFMKMLMVADGRLAPELTTGDALAGIAADANRPGSLLIQTLPDLQANLIAHGFLLLNAALVFRPHVPPSREARAWQPFLQIVLDALAVTARHSMRTPADLVLWGKVAAQVESLTLASDVPRIVSEHPYNLTFIVNPTMHSFFKPMALLGRRNTDPIPDKNTQV